MSKSYVLRELFVKLINEFEEFLPPDNLVMNKTEERLREDDNGLDGVSWESMMLKLTTNSRCYFF